MSTINCCPHCSGTSGFSFTMHVEHHMVGLWGEHAEEGDSGKTKDSLATCLDCKRKVRSQTAQGDHK